LCEELAFVPVCVVSFGRIEEMRRNKKEVSTRDVNDI
jgi:hypothetical protein